MTKKNTIAILLSTVLITGALLFLFYTSIVLPAFGHYTCGASDFELEEFLQENQGHNATLIKTAENGRIKAAIYQRDDLGLCVAMFDRKLFGLRWRYDGMNQLPDEGMCVSGAWNYGGKCYIVISGDNRSGVVGSYILSENAGVARDSLASDYIIDIYVLDGIDHFPGNNHLQEFAPDGTPLDL